MDVVLRAFLVEACALGVVVELPVDFLEVPGILELDDVQHHLRLGRDGFYVGLHAFGEGKELLVEDEVQLVDR